MDSFEVKTEGTLNDAERLLKDLFRPETKPYDLLKSAIEREFRPNGAPEVKRMKIDRIKYDIDTGKGSFRVVLDIDYTFGCEDLLTQKSDETSEWTFDTDSDNKSITFYASPYTDSRTTADEF